MQQQIDQILKPKQKQGQRAQLSQLWHKQKQQKPQIDQQTIQRLQKLKKYTHQDISIPTQKLNSYYCSLCGQITLVTNIYLESMPKRRTDNAIAIDLRQNFVKTNLHKQKIRHIKRQEGVEVQYRWRCDCGIPIAYTCISYDDFQSTRQNQQHKSKNIPYLYIYENALSQKMKQSKLVSELITYKETILLHLKKKMSKR